MNLGPPLTHPFSMEKPPFQLPQLVCHELRTESVLARVKAGLLEGHGNRARRLRMEQDLNLWTRGGGIQGRLGAAYPLAQAESMGGSEARKEGPGPGGLA